MAQYEVTFIVDPVLSGDESKATAKTYQDMLTEKGGSIVNVDSIGLRSLAYAINKRTTGVYYCVEFQSPGSVVDELELALRRDERIMRFLTVKLEKYGVKYNQDKRDGKIGRRKAKVSEEIAEETGKPVSTGLAGAKPKPQPAAKAAPVEAAPAPVAAAPAVVEADDLTKVEGIGPKINELLQAAGISTFKQLADATVESVKEILVAKGGTYKTKDPGTWGQQAQLAVDGKWDELKELQDRLDGGKEA
ncbi:MAG: 30S ribosomal protein S6 [Saprospiraceae bacterium]